MKRCVIKLIRNCSEGPSPNNTNLAIKGILGLGSYAMLEQLFGNDNATSILAQAQVYVDDWLNQATYQQHYMRQYNLTTSWSLKYNLLYQYVLDLPLFPEVRMHALPEVPPTGRADGHCVRGHLLPREPPERVRSCACSA